MDSRRNSDSFTTEEYQFRLDTFASGTLEDDPVSVRLGQRTHLRPSYEDQHAFELLVDHFFPSLNRPRYHSLEVWYEGYNATGTFGGPPHDWFAVTLTGHVQSLLTGIGTQFGDY
ncbi:hypothetical protein FPOAC1_000361 [Fusarium poae]|jgi:hypothetical protein|nr:hypothetical protein FPOAC1_000361 [Fusarium poae]KAG8674394.1 hypothetical protein FPOAC1_000361 [Fusarium poae]